MKKTALDDDAAIYQKDTQSRRQKWQQMDTAQKIKYFCDYYLIKALAALGLCGAVVFLIYSIFFRQREVSELYVVVVDEVLDNDVRKTLEQNLRWQLQAVEDYQQVIIDDAFYMPQDGLTKLEVYLSNGQVDVLIAQEETFRTLAGYGFFQNLEEILPEELAERYNADYVKAAGYLDHEENGFEDLETGRGEVLPYGICLQENSRWKTEIGALTETPVFGITQGAKNLEHAFLFLQYLTEI